MRGPFFYALPPRLRFSFLAAFVSPFLGFAFIAPPALPRKAAPAGAFGGLDAVARRRFLLANPKRRETQAAMFRKEAHTLRAAGN